MIGENAWLWECIDYDAQKWIIQLCGNGYYNIISKCNGLYLHLDATDAVDGTNINMWNWGTGNESIPYTSSIAVEKLPLSQTILTLQTGESATLTAAISPGNATNKTLT